MGRPLTGKPRPIVAKLLKFTDKERILQNSKKLKGSQIFINEDLCEGSRAKRRAQLPQLKQARAEGKIAYFSHTKLIVKERSPIAAGTTNVNASVAPPNLTDQRKFPLPSRNNHGENSVHNSSGRNLRSNARD